MPKCPECGEEIDHLNHYQAVTVKYIARLDAQGRMDYEEKDRTGGDGTGQYNCPKCEETLFATDAAAIQFLKLPPPMDEIIAEIERIRTLLLPPAGETVTQEDAASAEEALDRLADKLKGKGEPE